MRTPESWLAGQLAERPDDFDLSELAAPLAWIASVQADARKDLSGWILVTDLLPDLDRIVEMAVVDHLGGLYRAFGCRYDEGEGWLWALASYSGIPDRADDCEADDDYSVYAWRLPTPLPPPPPEDFDGRPQAISPPKPETP